MPSPHRQLTILVTGFGPFPGARFNPTAPLMRTLARLRRPVFGDVRIVTHVFPTRYAAVDTELPALIEKYRPDIVLMFGLAARTRHVRVEMLARNARAMTPDASGFSGGARAIAAGAAPARKGIAPFVQLLRAALTRGVRARLSRNAGHYLCNYAYWRALEAAEKPGGPGLVAFIHVPKTQSPGIPSARVARRAVTPSALAAAAEAMMRVLLQAWRQSRLAPHAQTD